MKTPVLEAYTNLPQFQNEQALQKANNSFIEVHVTEAVDTERVDILVDRNLNIVKVRVDGKGRGTDWKLWKDHFEATTGSNYLLQTSPIDLCIIRCATSREPRWLKVLGVVSVDPVSKETKWIPFSMVKNFCNACNMSPMPTTYTGPMNFEKIKGLVNKPILGVKRDGIYVIPELTPTQYIKISVNVDAEALKPSNIFDMRGMSSLAEEFANLAFDEREFKLSVGNPDEMKRFVSSTIQKASENMLLAQYVQRGEAEAGVKPEEAGIELRAAVMERCEKLWRRYA